MSTTTSIILRHKPNTRNEHKILVRITHNGKKTDLSTDHSVLLEMFDKRKQKVKSKHLRADKINYDVEQFKRRIDDIIFDLKQEDLYFDVKSIRAKLIGENPMNTTSKLTFSQYLSDYIDLNPDSLSINTLVYYKSTLTRWNELYIDVLLTDVSEKHIVELRKHLIDKYQNRVNTLYNRLKTIRKMLHRAARNGLIDSNPFRYVTIKQEKGTREYLTLSELNKIEAFIPQNDSESRVKNAFLFSSYSGLRFSDICTLNKSNFKQIASGIRLKFKMHKTKEVLEFNLNRRAIEIYNRYKATKNHYVFPLIKYQHNQSDDELKRTINASNAYSNKVLRDIIVNSNVEKKISFHCARHTFATVSITKGADLYVVSKVLGHNAIATTEIYAKLVDNRKQELTDLWNE